MEELMKEEKEGVKAAEQEKPKKRRNRKKNRKNEMRKSYFAGVAEDGGEQSDDQPALRGRCG